MSNNASYFFIIYVRLIIEMVNEFFSIEIYSWNIKPRIAQRLTVYILLIVEIVTEWKWQINNISMTYWCMWKSIFMKIMYSFLVNLLAVIFNRGNRNVFSLQPTGWILFYDIILIITLSTLCQQTIFFGHWASWYICRISFRRRTILFFYVIHF